MKRLMDITIAAAGVVLLFPMLIFIMVVLRLTGEGEVLYRQTRVGKGGKTFRLLKFATMLRDSPNIGTRDITLRNDPRVLPIGRLLRKTKLNELPQLYNVLIGDMSIVGPRPLTPGIYEMIPEDIRERTMDLHPGLTGIGSIVFRDEEKYIGDGQGNSAVFYREHIAPFKGKLEEWYKEHRSIGLDISLMLMTGWVIMFPSSRLPQAIYRSLPKHPLFNK
jgi:lipopolysaccharide/colanic/teichoic acid biosynthesis glycosyltransferase